MNKRELIERLEALPDDVVFLVSSDQEGNELREANLGGLEKGYDDGEWFIVHPDDLDEYEGNLKNVAVFW